jgi:hypothetical protein
MLIALAAVHEPFSLWILPHLLAVLAGAGFIFFRRSSYRLSLWAMLVLVALLALVFAWTSDGWRYAFRSENDVRLFGYWWGTGCLVTVPLALIFGARFVNDFYVVFVDPPKPRD